MKDKLTKVSVVLTRDKQMQRLNKSVFRHDEQTDVISFPLDSTMDEGKNYLGEIVINQDQVERNAQDYGVTYAQELARVVTHGVLHLLGYTDDTPEEKIKMTAIEDAVVSEIEVED